MDEETRDHLALALNHLRFARDLIWSTGKLAEFNELSWPYGTDHNGQGEVTACQLDTVAKLLIPELQTVVELFCVEDEEFLASFTDRRGETMDPMTYPIEYVAILVQFTGDEKELLEWEYLLKWLSPRSVMGRYEENMMPHFVWMIPTEEGVDESAIDAYYAMLKAWEVREFYEHTANSSAWRQFRGSDDPHAETGSVA